MSAPMQGSPVDSGLRDDLEKTVDRVFEAHCGKAVREGAENGEWPAGLWGALDEVGLTPVAFERALIDRDRLKEHLFSSFGGGRREVSVGRKGEEGIDFSAGRWESG